MKIKFIPPAVIALSLFIGIFFLIRHQRNTDQNTAYYRTQLQLVEKYKQEGITDMTSLPKRDRPDLAYIQEFEMTMDPDLGYPPTERKLSAYRQTMRQLDRRHKNARAVAGVEWKERGPDNVAGRTRALMFDPNDPEYKKVWAGAIGGGLWYNNDITDRQSQWKPVDDLFANLAISSIAHDPNDTQLFYFSTGLGYTQDIRGLGIWRSSDGGANWDQIAATNNNADFYLIQKIVVTKASTVLVTTTTGLYRSENNGDTWTKILEGRFGDIELTSGAAIYATEGVANSQGKIRKSVDDGRTWTDITPESKITPRRIEIESAPSNPAIVYAVADGGVDGKDVAFFKKSVDGGNIWTDVTIPLYVEEENCEVGEQHFTRAQAFFDLILAVHPQNPGVVIAGGIDLHKSEDGGLTWNPISNWAGTLCDDYVHADQHEIVFRPEHPGEAIFGTDGGVAYSKNAGIASNPEFETRNNGYNVTTFYSVAMENEPTSTRLIAGAQDNGTIGLNSVGVGAGLEVTGGDGGFCFIDQDNSNIKITSFVYNNYLLSQDGGLTFRLLHYDEEGLGRFINPTEYDSEADILYGAGESDELTRITNISSSPSRWRRVFVGFSDKQITTIKASPHTANRLFVGVRVFGGEGRLYRIDNADATRPTATDITGAYEGSHGSWVSSIDVGTNDNELLATFSNYGVSSVYTTSDGGNTWINKNDNLPDMPVRWGLYNPNNRNQVLLATEVGVWSTDNINAANPGWEPSNSGLANVRVNMLRYRESDGVVAAATYGRGVFTSDIFAQTSVADFSTAQTVAYAGTPVHFADASLLAGGSWQWDFGDSNTSADQHPSHTYVTPGTYSISLTIAGGARKETKENYITVLPSLAVPYTLADGGNFETNPDHFTSASLLNGINHWERGTPGNRLTQVNSGTHVWKTGLGSDIINEGFDYACALYTPAFDLSPNDKEYTLSFVKSMENGYCNVPHALQVQYSTDGGIHWFTLGTSQGEPEGLNWYNQGDNLGCSVEQRLFSDKIGWVGSNVTVNGRQGDNTVEKELTEYRLNDLAGASSVSFRFVSSVIAVTSRAGRDDNGSVYNRDGFLIDDFQLKAINPTAAFYAGQTVGFVGKPVQFIYASNAASAFAWNFGDGTTSEEKDPAHEYTEAGVYSVSLQITSAAGTVTNTRNGYITILPQRTTPYTPEDGGNFEVNLQDFAAVNIAGTPLELGSSAINGKDGTASGSNAWVTGLSASQYADESEAWLVTPEFSFRSLGQYTLEFKAKYAFEPTWDGFIVQYSIDQGSSWVKLNNIREGGWYNQISDPFSVFGAKQPIFSGTTRGEFKTFSTDVSFLHPAVSVAFRFLFLSDAATVDVGIALDDFTLLGPGEGPGLAAFTLEGNTGCDGMEVTFTNASTGNIYDLTWQFGENATPRTATGIGPHIVTYSSASIVTNTPTLVAESPINGTTSAEQTFIIAPVHDPGSFGVEYLGISPEEARLTAPAGDAYQWQKDGEDIEGATAQTLLISEFNLNYRVLVNVNGCIVPSRQTVISSTDAAASDPSIFPNPVSKILTIDLGKDRSAGDTEIEMYSPLGRLIFTEARRVLSSDNGELQIDVSDLERGVYILKWQAGDASHTHQIFINHD